ncbi:RIPOR family member 3-like [Salmo trutta]|uniref:RIPOR family member 3-like n=1 Tax=Salmo trutta TaxID=8032 RepID=UPI0011306299|nr:RIPOR family member 3-like [Salmo trutta]
MSLKLRFECQADHAVQWSRSFTGFSTVRGRRRVSSVRNSLRSKALSGKSPMFHPFPVGWASVFGDSNLSRWTVSSRPYRKASRPEP